MAAVELVLLPGLDGTGELFGEFVSQIGDAAAVRVVSYPADRVLSYGELLPLIEQSLPLDPPAVLVAESFSGPLALKVAARWPHRVAAVVLVASFGRCPVRPWMVGLAQLIVRWVPLNGWMVRAGMAGWGAPGEIVDSVVRAVGRVEREVLVGRLKEVMAVDSSEDLASCRVPVIYLGARGDRLVQPATAQWMRKRCPSMRVRWLDGPHLLLQVNPELAWREIRAFLEDIGMHPSR